MKKIDESKLNDWQKVQNNFITEVSKCLAVIRMTNSELAKIIGISQSYWSEIRNLDKPIRLSHMVAICQYLKYGISLNFIVNDK